MFKPSDFLDLKKTAHGVLFDGIENVWEALGKISHCLKSLSAENNGKLLGSPFIGEKVFIGKGTVIEHGAVVKGPAWIGENCEIRSGCYIRENVIIGNGVVAGNSSEFKNSIVFDECQVPHFNYVGDSILGYKVHLAAGVILSNVKLTRDSIKVCCKDEMFDTGLRKFGAIVGDRTEIGCNSVLFPGSILGRDCLVYPGVQWRGVLKARSIVKMSQVTEVIERRFC